MGSASDQRALSRSSETVQRQLNAIFERKDPKMGLVDILVSVEMYSVDLVFKFADGSDEFIHISCDPDNAELWEGR